MTRSIRRLSALLRPSSVSFLLTLSIFIVTFIPFSYATDAFECFVLDSTLHLVNASDLYNSRGACGNACRMNRTAVFAMSGEQCFCGNKLPSSPVALPNCAEPCPGWPPDNCGGDGFLAVYVTGVGTLQGKFPTDSSLTASPSTSVPTAVSQSVIYITTGGTTITQTPTSTSSSSADSNSSGGSSFPAGATAGIVVGVIALVSIGAGVLFFNRRRRRVAYRTNYKQTGFASSSSSSALGGQDSVSGSMVDQRLEPQMLQQRYSVGSLADERDYSRKILRVTNPDGR